MDRQFVLVIILVLAAIFATSNGEGDCSDDDECSTAEIHESYIRDPVEEGCYNASTNVTVTCDNANGNTTITCDNGEWSKNLTQPCGNCTTSDFGDHVVSVITLVGETVEPTCEAGFYSTDGSKNATCTLPGEWEYEDGKPECNATNNCTVKGECWNIAIHESYIRDNVTYCYANSTNVTVTCGTVTENATTITCESGSWSEDLSQSCGNCTTSDFDDDVVQKPSADVITVGEVVKFSCAEGFESTGSTNATCTSPGMWKYAADEKPQCESKGNLQFGALYLVPISALLGLIMSNFV